MNLLLNVAAFGLIGIGLLGGNAAAAGKRPVDEETSSQRGFETDAAASKRRSKELTDALKIRGRGQFFNLLGTRALHEGDALGAQESFRKMMEVEPGSPGGYANLGTSLFLEGDYAGAITLYTEAIVRAKDKDDALDLKAQRARAYLEVGRTEDALADTEAGLGENPPPVKLLLVRTHALMRAGDPAGAAKTYRALRLAHHRRRPDAEDAALCRGFGVVNLAIDVCRNGS